MKWVFGVLLVAVGLTLQWAAGAVAGVGWALEVAGNSLAEPDIMP
jgi:hypothetical protein